MFKFKPLAFEEAIPRLVHTYNKGKLVPFTGAGVSAPQIPLWPEFISNLAAHTSMPVGNVSTFSPGQLIQASEKIIIELRNGDSSSFSNIIKASMGYKENSEPVTSKTCEALSKIWWPLLLTTNYDRMFVNAYTQKHSEKDGPVISVYGRNQRDCHTLLSSLNAPVRSIYWALQGYFGSSANNEDLEKEIVICYGHYRQATYNNQIFRSAFGEVFRNYSLFFIGSGLSEDYFRGLFDQTLESFGSNPNTHYALFHEDDICSGKVDPHFLHTKLNIISIYYSGYRGDHSGLAASLALLNEEIHSSSRKMYKFSFNTTNIYKPAIPGTQPDFEVINGNIPVPASEECCIISAGLDKIVKLSGQGERIIGDQYDANKFQPTMAPLVYQYEARGLYAAVARNEQLGPGRQGRDLRTVYDAFIQALRVTNGKYHIIHCMHLAAGSKRTFPPVFSFIQMLHAFKDFSADNEVKSTVRIYVSHPSAVFFIRKNILELEELLNCDETRFNVEIQHPLETERFTFYAKPEIKFMDISDYFQIDHKFWQASIFPEPYQNPHIPTDADLQLQEVGVIPGSIIRYKRIVDAKK